jgi:hypothetical protein
MAAKKMEGTMGKRLRVIFLVCGISFIMGCSTYQNVMRGGTATEILPAGQKLVTAAWKGQDLWILTRQLHEGEALETYEFHPLIKVQGSTEGKVILKEIK